MWRLSFAISPEKATPEGADSTLTASLVLARFPLATRCDPFRMTTDGTTKPLRSQDGRFELRVEEFWERASPTYTTRLFDLSAGAEIFSCEGSVGGEFNPEGKLILRHPGYEHGGGIVIDPAQRQFRSHLSEPWVPLAAWPLVESAFHRGWAAAWKHGQQATEASHPWVEGILAAVSLIGLLLLLVFGSALRAEQRIVLTIVAAIATVFFTWLWLNAVRHWRQFRNAINPRRSRPDPEPESR